MPPDPFWVKQGTSANDLTEFINNPNDDDDVFALNGMSSGVSVPLGEGFDSRAVAADVGNFGTHGEDLTFIYSAPGLGIVRGLAPEVAVTERDHRVAVSVAWPTSP